MILRIAVLVFVACLIAFAVVMSRSRPRVISELGSEHEAHGDVPWMMTQARYPSARRSHDSDLMGM